MRVASTTKSRTFMPAGQVFHDHVCQSQTHEGSPSAVLNTQEWTVEWTVEWKEVGRASRRWRRPRSSAGVEAAQIASSHRTCQRRKSTIRSGAASACLSPEKGGVGREGWMPEVGILPRPRRAGREATDFLYC